MIDASPGDPPWVEHEEVFGILTLRWRHAGPSEVSEDGKAYALYFEITEGEEVNVEGSIKWDGCMNWQTSDDCLYHFCEPEGADALASALKAVWPIAAENLATWDGAK